jgi:hypothetical protein
MAKVNVNGLPIKRSIQSIDLSLSLDEARALILVLGQIGGDTKPRHLMSKLYDSLKEVPELKPNPFCQMIGYSDYNCGLQFIKDDINEAFDG